MEKNEIIEIEQGVSKAKYVESEEIKREICAKIAKDLSVQVWQVEKTVELIDEGNTIPFIARYRKEVTGTLDDVQLRNLEDLLNYSRSLYARKDEIIRLITDLGFMTDEIMDAIKKADKLSELEDIYRPFKPKRRTRASIAKERGLEPLSSIMLVIEDVAKIEEEALKFVNPELGVNDAKAAIDGACDILAEYYADRADIRSELRAIYNTNSVLKTELVDGKDEEKLYDMYHNFNQKALTTPPHRVLAINRAEREGVLRVNLDVDVEGSAILIANNLDIDMPNSFVKLAYDDGLKRLVVPSMEREIRNLLTEKAEEQAISVFAANLKQKLLAPPFKNKVIMGYDPAYRTGCKLSIIDSMGRFCDYDTIYPTKPQEKVAESKATILKLIDKYKVDLIAIGNGTASRESEAFVVECIKECKREVKYVIVDEAGASVYSASELANQEYPDIDVSIRGAISIAQRLQDPLGELVKIDPKSIGVGQYQHDVNQKRLSTVLDNIVEDAVNKVGVDVNSASEVLLGYIAGISKKTAKALVDERYKLGGFKNRAQIKKVKGIGPVSYQQAVGFLRITDGDNVFDSTGVHPEDYENFEHLMKMLDIKKDQIGKAGIDAYKKACEIGLDKISKDLNIHKIRLEDILKEIDKPARDPRLDAPAPILRSDVLTMEDLAVGMSLKGTIRNIVDFGAFVDIGVKQDGLVHISKMANKFVKHPLDVVKLGDVVDVTVIEIDHNRKKIALSMV